MADMTVVEKAVRIAADAHGDARRKADGVPYLTHPFMVALKLARLGFEERVIAAALVHDVLEDTDYPPDKLRTELGTDVFEMVEAVTNSPDGTWAEKKRQYVESVRNGTEGTKAIAVADKIHNLECLLIAHAEQGSAVWSKFTVGKDMKVWFGEEVLGMLKDTWQHPLIAEYERLLELQRALK